MISVQYLGLITARKGSKRLPGKNTKLLCGKPLIAYTIEAALSSTRLDRVIVSTEDMEIASVARHWGAEVPFQRPNELATDGASSIDVMLDALSWLKSHEDYTPDAVVLLQPTCPLRTGAHIDEAIGIFEERDADCVVAITKPQHHPYWMKTMDHDGQLTPFMHVDLRHYHQKQMLPELWVSNSSIYVIRYTFFLLNREIYGGRTFGYIMQPSEGLDIDTAWDFYLANLIFAARSRNAANPDEGPKRQPQ